MDVAESDLFFQPRFRACCAFSDIYFCKPPYKCTIMYRVLLSNYILVKNIIKREDPTLEFTEFATLMFPL